MKKPWAREDIIVAYALYCITPLKKINLSNKTILQVAEIMERSPSSLVMRMRNLTSLDPSNPSDGLIHVAKADKLIFEEFKNDWGNLSVQAEQITGLALFDDDNVNGAKKLSSLNDRKKVNRERYFFKKAVSSAYENTCGVTRLGVRQMLIASHIKPFNMCRSSCERTNPQNGILLNAFHDRAFDLGLFTITPDLTFHTSARIEDYKNDETMWQWLLCLEGQKFIQPLRFSPRKDFLEYHNDMVFKR